MDNIFGDKKIKIIRHAGDLNEITLEDGTVVHRKQELELFDFGIVKCAPYSEHFIFQHVFGGRGWTLWCSCNSPAGVTGYDAYKRDASRQGQMLVCLAHAQSGKHLDGMS